MAGPEARRAVFIKPGSNARVTFFLHENLTDGQKDAIKERILANGGQVVYDKDRAFDCIIVKEEDLSMVSKKYENSRTVYVEPISFINRCIRQGGYDHDMIARKGMGGFPPGSSRAEYTVEDDKHLAEYLAIKIPHREAGGRLGNNIYKLLVDSADDFPWATRHTWQSWRNRYKNFQDKINAMIDQYNKLHPPNEHGRGEYGLDRRAILRISRHNINYKNTESDEEGEEEPAEQEARDDEARSRSITPTEVGKSSRLAGIKRRIDDDDGSPERPRQKRAASEPQVADENRSSDADVNLNNGDDYEWDQLFTPDINLELYEEIPAKGNDAPVNTQSTLVSGAHRTKNVKHATDQVGENSSTPGRARAARNRERAKMEREAKAKALESAIPPDTQATVVGPTQAGPSTRPQTQARHRSSARKTVANIDALPAKPVSKQKRAGPSKGPSIEEMRNAFGREQSEQPVPVVVGQDAPYRNTRARSRSVSVEPQRLPPPQKRGARKKPALEIVKETQFEDEEPPSVEENSVDAVESVIEVEEETQQTSANVEQPHVGMRMPESDEEEDDEEEEEELELDELDDAGNDDVIRAHAVSLLSRPRSDLNAPSPASYKSPFTTSASRSFLAAKQTAAVVFSTPPRVPLSASNASVGQPLKAGKGNPVSSESDFPASGTQARREKYRRIDQSKKSPYNPPSVTRAAEILQRSSK